MLLAPGMASNALDASLEEESLEEKPLEEWLARKA